ncbi:MAG: DUF4258 domain-containing protein [Betaproteobacteria bacterium]|nr:DUF4258 domain-containing protein [Betaproteobacteria bacterium]
MNWVLSAHAETELQRREIPFALLEQVMTSPEQIVPELRGLAAYQSRVAFPDGATYLLRAIVAERDPLTVVTVYRTSRIEKYWRTS